MPLRFPAQTNHLLETIQHIITSYYSIAFKLIHIIHSSWHVSICKTNLMRSSERFNRSEILARARAFVITNGLAHAHTERGSKYCSTFGSKVLITTTRIIIIHTGLWLDVMKNVRAPFHFSAIYNFCICSL